LVRQVLTFFIQVISVIQVIQIIPVIRDIQVIQVIQVIQAIKSFITLNHSDHFFSFQLLLPAYFVSLARLTRLTRYRAYSYNFSEAFQISAFSFITFSIKPDFILTNLIPT